MSVYRITIPKPPDDVWAVEVDFSDRLDTDNGEELSSVSVEAYRLWGYDQVLDDYDISEANRINLTIETASGEQRFYSYLTEGAPSAQIRIPSSYDPTLDLSIVDPATITIGPSSGTPPNVKVSFHIQNGWDGYRYALLVTATTNKGRQHSCVIRFSVQALPYVGSGT